MKTLILSIVAVLLLSGGRSFSQETRFQEAWYREVAEGRFEDALETYRELTADEDLSASLRARALFRCGVVLRKLQRTGEALEVFQQVLREFPDEREVVLQARREIEGETEAQASLRKKVEGLVRLLGDKDPRTRGRAQMDLKSIGPAAAPSLLEALGGGEYNAVSNAATLLVGFADSDPTLIAALVGALRSGDPVVRKSIRSALAKDTSRVWGEVLLELLRDEDVGMRVLAASVLGRRANNPAALEALRSRASDPSPDVRAAILEALESYGQPDLLPVFVKALDDPAASVRVAALEAIEGGFRRTGVTPHRGGALYQVGGGSPSSVDAARLLALLDDPSPEVVRQTLRTLERAREISSPGAVFPGGPATAQATARATVRATARLGRLALDPEQPEDLRRAAVLLLAWSDREEAYGPVVEAIESESAEVSLAALRALRDREDPDFAATFLNTVRLSSNAEARDLAWEALAQLASRHPLIQAVLVEDLPDLGDKAARVVDLVDWNERRDLVLGILEHYEALDAAARVRILYYVRMLAGGDYGFPEGIPVVVAGLQDESAAVQKAAVVAAAAFSDATQLTPHLTPLIEVEDHGTRLHAVRALGRTRDPRAVPALVAALEDPGPEVARHAAGALIELKAVEVVSRVLPVVVDPLNPRPEEALWVLQGRARPGDAAGIGRALGELRADLREDAVRLLGSLESPEAIPFLRETLKDPDPQVRVASVNALWATGGDDVVPDLVAALHDPEYRVRQAAIEALVDANPARILAAPEALTFLGSLLRSRRFAMREAVVDALVRLPDRRAIPLLLEALREGDSRADPNPTAAKPLVRSSTRSGVRRTAPVPVGRRRTTSVTGRPSLAERASKALVAIGDRNTVAPLLAMLETGLDENPWLEPRYIFEILEKHATADDAPLLAAALEKLEPELRVGLLKILQDLGAGDQLTGLVRYLDDEDPQVRMACVEVLTSIPDPAALHGLIRALSDPHPAVRASAARALHERGDPAAVGALASALERETSRQSFETIVNALERFADPAAIPALVHVFKKEVAPGPTGINPFPALDSLQSYPAEAAVDAIGTLLSDPALPPERRYSALWAVAGVDHPKALELVLRYADSPDEDQRYSVARTLGFFFDPRALPALVTLLKDPKERVRKQARESLDKVRYYLEQKRFAEEAARERRALEEIHSLLENPSPLVRLAAVKALVRLESRDSLAVLVRLRKDENEDVREAVDEALEALSRSAAAAPR